MSREREEKVERRAGRERSREREDREREEKGGRGAGRERRRERKRWL